LPSSVCADAAGALERVEELVPQERLCAFALGAGGGEPVPLLRVDRRRVRQNLRAIIVSHPTVRQKNLLRCASLPPRSTRSSAISTATHSGLSLRRARPPHRGHGYW